MGAVEAAAVKRFNKLGLDMPAEKTVQAVAACVAATWWPSTLPTAHEAYMLCISVKGALRRTPLSGPRGPAVYPVNPSGLPLSLRVHAYDSDDPPVSHPSSRFFLMKGKMILRRSNSALKDQHDSQRAPANAAAADPMQSLLQMFRMAAPLLQPGRPMLSQPSGSDIQLQFLNTGPAQHNTMPHPPALGNGSPGPAGGSEQGLVLPAKKDTDTKGEDDEKDVEDTL